MLFAARLPPGGDAILLFCLAEANGYLSLGIGISGWGSCCLVEVLMKRRIMCSVVRDTTMAEQVFEGRR